jgi:hypothetical protein
MKKDGFEEIESEEGEFFFKVSKIKPGDRIRYISYVLDYDSNPILDEKLFRTG